MAYCIHCGKQNTETARFCTGCGAPLKYGTVSPGIPAAQQDTEPGKSFAGNRKNKKIVWAIVGLVALLGLGAGAYFLFLKQKKGQPVMMVVPDVLKLRSSKSDVADDNVLGTASYGTSVTILDSTDVWYTVKLGDKTGYMHSKHLCSPKEFVEIKAIIQSAGTPTFEGAQKITESGFKKSLLHYFRLHNYIAEIPADEKEKYFAKEELSGREVWRISNSSQYALAFIKGNFSPVNKKGIGVKIENVNDPTKKKLVIFNYNEDETEASASGFDEPGLIGVWKGSDGYVDFNGNSINPGVDIILCNVPGEDGIYTPFYIYRNGKMERDYDYQYGD